MFIKYQIYKKQVSTDGMDWSDTDETKKGSILGIYETLAACEGGEDPDTPYPENPPYPDVPYPDNPNDPDYGKPYEDRYFTIEVLANAKLKLNEFGQWKRRTSRRYAVNKEQWIDINDGDSIFDTGITLNKGDVVRFSANDEHLNNTYSLASPMFNVSGGAYRVYGNLTTLSGNNIDICACAALFYGETNLFDASGLIFPDVVPREYLRRSFYNCTNLKYPPKILPAKRVDEGGYQEMFRGCKNIDRTPELLCTDVYLNGCYEMFRNCTNLKYPPSKMNLEIVYYDGMLRMFMGCTSLEYSPQMLIEKMNPMYEGRSIFASMFKDCTNLKLVKNLSKLNAEDDNATYYEGWLANVSSTGTFIKKKGATWIRSENGIPVNWTVEEVD